MISHSLGFNAKRYTKSHVNIYVNATLNQLNLKGLM